MDSSRLLSDYSPLTVHDSGILSLQPEFYYFNCNMSRMHAHFSVILSRLLSLCTSSSAKINPLTPNDTYSGRTAPLTSKRCILYIYSTNTSTEYFKHGIHSPFFSLQNAVCFIILTNLVPVLFTFYIQDVLKFKK